MTAVIQQAIECVLSLFLIGLVGFILDRRRWFTPETKAMLPRLVLLISLPPYLFRNIVTTFNRDELIHLVYGALIPAVSIVVTLGLSAGVARLLGVRRDRAGIFIASFTFSNTIFIGLPINVSLFGVEALPYVLLYFFANTTFFWTVGNYILSRDGDRRPEKILSLATVKHLFSPPLIGFFLGLLVVIAQVQPPKFLMDALGYIGGLTTPLAIIFIGITLSGVNFRALKPEREVLVAIIGRLLICPALVILLTRLVEVPPLMAKVFIIQSSLPVISSVALLAGYHRADAEYASLVVSSSTVLSLFTIPAYMVLLSVLSL